MTPRDCRMGACSASKAAFTVSSDDSIGGGVASLLIALREAAVPLVSQLATHAAPKSLEVHVP